MSDSIISIGNSAFADCRNLTSVTIPKNVASIESLAFSGCNLKTVTIDSASIAGLNSYISSELLSIASTIFLKEGPSLGEGISDVDFVLTTSTKDGYVEYIR